MLGSLLLAPRSGAEPRPTDRCRIDHIGQGTPDTDAVNVSEAVPFEVAGWIVDARGERIPLRARLRLSPEEGGQPVELALHRWHERLDVARLFHSRAYLVAGFSVQVPAGSLRPGRWKLSLLYQRKRRLRTCEDGSSVYVEAAQ